jgi:filamentous hemagglutinin
VTASVGGSSQSTEAHSQASNNQGTTVTAGNGVTIVATGSGAKGDDGFALDGDIRGRGAQIIGKDVTLVAARDVDLQSAQDTASQSRRSDGSNASIGVGFGLFGSQNGFTLELAASTNMARGDGDSVTNHNTHVTASDTLTVASGRDTNLRGAQLTGDQIVADVGRNLNIESRQDTETYYSKEQSSGAQVSICVPPFCVGTTVSGSASVSQGNTDSTYRSVVEQSGLYAGQGGFDVTVKGNTDLKGGILASAADAGKNHLTTGTLTTSDLENKAEYSSDSSTIAGSFSMGSSVPASNPNLGPVQAPHVDWSGAGKAAAGALTNSAIATAMGNAVPASTGSASGVTQSAIAPGTVTITDNAAQQALTGKTAEETIAALNRDTVNANQAIDKIFDAQKVKDEQALRTLAAQTVQQAMPMIDYQIGNWLKGQPEAVKVAVHGLVGGLITAAVGGEFAKGAVGTAAGVGAIAMLDHNLRDLKMDESTRNAVLQTVGMVVAGVVGGGGANGAAAAGATGMADTYNRQLHNVSDADLRRKAADLAKDPKYAGMTQEEIYYAIRTVYRNDQVGTGDLKSFDTQAQANAAGVPVAYDSTTGKWLEDPEVATGRLNGTQRMQLDSQLRGGPVEHWRGFPGGTDRREQAECRCTCGLDCWRWGDRLGWKKWPGG